MQFPPKAISILLLVQCLFIWLGHSIVRKMVRFREQAELPAAWTHPLPASVNFVLGFGFWAFLLPLLWTAWVMSRSEAPSGIPAARASDTQATVGLTVVTACLWSWAAMQALNLTFGASGPITAVAGP